MMEEEEREKEGGGKWEVEGGEGRRRERGVCGPQLQLLCPPWAGWATRNAGTSPYGKQRASTAMRVVGP